MATLLKLIQGEGGTTLDLNVSTATGFKIDEDGWIPAIATPVYMDDPPPVREVINLILSNTTYNNLATSMQSLHEMQVVAERYIKDPTQENPVWLHAQMNGETGVRRALVRSIDVLNKPTFFGTGQSTTNIPLMIIVTREPYWESTTARSLPDFAMSSGLANVAYDYTAAGAAVSAHDLVGDVGARIRLMDITEPNANLINTYWMGIRSANKHGTLANFINIWECEDGTNDTDATDTAGGSGGFQVVVSESVRDWDKSTNGGVFFKCLDITLANVTSNYSDNLGNYLWLLRGDVASSTKWEVKLRASYGNDYDYIETPIIEIDGDVTDDYFEMGIFPIGLRDRQSIITSDVAASKEQTFTISIYARRSTGSADLYLDCLIPIPVDEGFAKFHSDFGNQNNSFYFGRSPKGILKGAYEAALNTNLYGTFQVLSDNNFHLPPGDGRIYCTYWSSNGGLTDYIIFNDGDTGKYYERWLSLRGSE